MKLKMKDSHSEWHQGWGAGEGTVDREEYICPCGKGSVYYEKDNILVLEVKASGLIVQSVKANMSSVEELLTLNSYNVA